jgi:hypothetical protein
VAALVKRGVLREHTFLNDADAVLLTRNPAGLATALKKISSAGNARMKVPLPAAHLWIADPLADWVGIFSSHPSMSDRVDVLSRMSGEISPEMLSKAEEAGVEYANRRKEPEFIRGSLSGGSKAPFDRLRANGSSNEIWGKGKGEGSVFRAAQKSLFSDHFLVHEKDTEIAEMKVDFNVPMGGWTAEFTDYYAEEEWPGRFALKSGGSVLARAEKIGLALSSLNLTYLNKPLYLKAHLQEHRFDILEGDQTIGSVYFSVDNTHEVEVEVPSGFPLALTLFILWLVLIRK